jgi:subtilisin family serine protease
MKKSAFQSFRRSFQQGGFFKLRILFGVLLSFAAVTIVLLALGKASAQPRTSSVQISPRWDGFNAASKIAPWVMEHTANGQEAEFFVVFRDQADLSPAESFPTKSEKGRFVFQTLLTKAQTTQASILQLLRDRAVEHRSFYIVNAILVKGTRELADMLAARPEVARIEGNPLIHNNLPAHGAVEKAGPGPHIPATVEPGVNYTHAPQVWALGFTGQNIVVASADTGVRWTHNALKPHYRGWDGQNANHNFNWHDSIHDSVGNPCGNDSPFPCDDFFHGSHTTGTAIGDDGQGNQIGMAPGAQWIGCRNMDAGNGTPARYIECMEFFLAPYPINCTPSEGDPSKAPDVTINSWGCPASEGCSANTLQAAVAAQGAAGIQMVVAAGNSGSACSTVSEPPGIYEEAYSVGALTTGTDTIAGFSSRGPVTVDGSNRIKPDITAPGTGTRSADNSCDSCYTTASGTSMATPHISGAMALLWCALPSLHHQITASRDALNNSAVFISSTQCGAAGPPNNVYGWGRVDIAAAVGNPSPTATPTPTPTATATPSACGATATPTPTATATGTPAGCQYTFTTGSDSIVPGTTDSGNHTDDGDTAVALPFSFQLYDQTFNSVNVSSNGRVDFVCINEPGGYQSACLPAPANICPFDYTIFAPWSDFRTDAQAGCASFPGGTCGIFTSVSGSAPNRIFNIEWRAVYFNTPTATANFEVRLYENNPDKRFDIIFGTIQPGSDQLYVSGVQGPNNVFTQEFCTAGPPSAGSRTYTCAGGVTPTPTPTATASATATATATATTTPTPRPTPTPRFAPTPRPRPTPPPRP